MNTEDLRPRFKFIAPLEVEELAQIFKDGVSSDSSVDAMVLNRHIIVKIPSESRHYWSPQLDINLEKTENGTLIRGLIGPRPNVWTLFLFSYGIMALLGIIGSIVAMSHWTLGKESNWFWLIPASILGCIGLYFISKTGKKLGTKEMLTLYNFSVDLLQKNTRLEQPIEEI